MAKSHWLINPKRTEVKRFIKNDKSIDGVFEYMFVDTDSLDTIWKQWSPWRELLEFTIEPCADLDQTVALYC